MRMNQRKNNSGKQLEQVTNEKNKNEKIKTKHHFDPVNMSTEDRRACIQKLSNQYLYATMCNTHTHTQTYKHNFTLRHFSFVYASFGRQAGSFSKSFHFSVKNGWGLCKSHKWINTHTTLCRHHACCFQCKNQIIFLSNSEPAAINLNIFFDVFRFFLVILLLLLLFFIFYVVFIQCQKRISNSVIVQRFAHVIFYYFIA